MEFYLILDSSYNFIGLINGDINPQIIATEDDDQVINININNL